MPRAENTSYRPTSRYLPRSGADLALPRSEILVGAAKCRVNQMGIARAAFDTAFHCRTDKQKSRFATRLSVQQHFQGKSRCLWFRVTPFECNVQRLRMFCLQLHNRSAQRKES